MHDNSIKDETNKNYESRILL